MRCRSASAAARRRRAIRGRVARESRARKRALWSAVGPPTPFVAGAPLSACSERPFARTDPALSTRLASLWSTRTLPRVPARAPRGSLDQCSSGLRPTLLRRRARRESAVRRATRAWSSCAARRFKAQPRTSITTPTGYVARAGAGDARRRRPRRTVAAPSLGEATGKPRWLSTTSRELPTKSPARGESVGACVRALETRRGPRWRQCRWAISAPRRPSSGRVPDGACTRPGTGRPWRTSGRTSACSPSSS